MVTAAIAHSQSPYIDGGGMKMTHKLNVARGATSDSGSKSWSSELFESLGHNLQALWLPDECMTGSTGVCQDGPPRLFGSATVEVGISKVVYCGPSRRWVAIIRGICRHSHVPAAVLFRPWHSAANRVRPLVRCQPHKTKPPVSNLEVPTFRGPTGRIQSVWTTGCELTWNV